MSSPRRMDGRATSSPVKLLKQSQQPGYPQPRASTLAWTGTAHGSSRQRALPRSDSASRQSPSRSGSCSQVQKRLRGGGRPSGLCLTAAGGRASTQFIVRRAPGSATAVGDNQPAYLTTTVLRLTRAPAQPSGRPWSVVDVEIVDVGELHQQAVRTAAAGPEVPILQPLGRDLLQRRLRGAGVLCREQPARQIRR